MKRKILSKLLISGLLLFCNIQAFGVLMRVETNYERLGSPTGVYQSSNKQNSSTELLNLKNKVIGILGATSQKQGQNAGIATAIPMSLTAIEMDAISAPRSSWLTLLDNTNTLSMDIGTADLNNAQTWTLPTNLLDGFQSFYNEDFVPVTEVPEDLRFAAANKVVKSEYEDSGGNTIEVFEHYVIGNNAVDYLGVSYYYFLDEDEDLFDGDDFKFSDVPMQLNDKYTYQVQDDRASFRNLRYVESTKTIDAFGTLVTPYGSFECLRITFSVDQYTRPDLNSPYVNDLSSKAVGFVTDQGHYILANVSALSGTVTLQNSTFRVVAPTGILQDQSEVQINNDGDGVLISNTGVYIDVLTKTADEDAILDIESDDKGIMIPRLPLANRPAAPNQGLLIYQLDNTPGFYYYDGSNWTRLDNTTPAAASARVAAPVQTVAQPNAKVYKKGFGTLKNGSVFIPMKVANGMNPEEMLIQLQPEGACNGLYISNKTAEGFEVKELNNGKSNIKFSWVLDQL